MLSLTTPHPMPCLVVSLTALLLAAAHASAEAAASLVATASELSAALDASAAHIVLTDHFDVTSLPPRRVLKDGRAESYAVEAYFLNGGLLTLQSIRGMCDTAPAVSAPGWKAPQCVIDSDITLFHIYRNGGVMSDDLWIDALYVRHVAPFAYYMPGSVFITPDATSSRGKTLWLSQFGFSGGGEVFGVMTSMNALIVDSTFRASLSAGVLYKTGINLTVNSCSFATGSSFNIFWSMPDTIEQPVANEVLVLNSSFATGTGVTIESSTELYSDDAGGLTAVALDPLIVPFQGARILARDVADLPATSALPRLDDARFAAARAAAGDAASAAGIDAPVYARRFMPRVSPPDPHKGYNAGAIAAGIVLLAAASCLALLRHRHRCAYERAVQTAGAVELTAEDGTLGSGRLLTAA